MTGSPSQTQTVTDSTGDRSVGLTYGSNNLVSEMDESLAAGADGPDSARTWHYSYDSNGNLASYTDPASNTTQYCYSTGSQLLIKIVTPHGSALAEDCSTTNGTDVTDIAYDSSGRVRTVSFERQSGGPITFSFAGTAPAPGVNASNNDASTTTETDPYSQVTTYQYDTRDRVNDVISPMGYSTSASYDENNDVTAAVDPENSGSSTQNPTNFAFDAVNREYQIQTPSPDDDPTNSPGAKNNADYNASGNNYYQPTDTKSDQGIETDYTYNTDGKITSASVGTSTVYVSHQGDDGNNGANTCGLNGQAAYTDAVCETRDGDYDSANPTEHRTLYSYDSLGEMVSMTPPQPDHGRPAHAAWSYGYDNHSRLASKTDARGDTTSYTYDAMDHLTKISYAGGEYTTYSYDEDGDLTHSGDYTSSGTLISGTDDTRSYDDLNRLVSDTQGGYAATTQTWDEDSRLLSVGDGNGTVGYGYNVDGYLTSMVEPGGSCNGFSLSTPPTSGSGCILFDPNKDGNDTQILYPATDTAHDVAYNDDQTVYSFQNTGMDSGSGATFDNFSMDYTDPSGTYTRHLYARHNMGGVGNRRQFTYGGVGRETRDDRYDQNIGGNITETYSYCYDANGNLTGYTTTLGGSCSANINYDGANQELGSGHSYDLDGDEKTNTSNVPATGTARTSTWNPRQQLSSVTIGGVTMNNTYAGPTNDMLLTSDTSSTGQDQLRYDSRGINEITHTESGSQTSQLYVERTPQGQPVALRTASGTEYYVLGDERGSIVRVVDTGGNSIDSYHYSPYGTRIVGDNSLPQPLGFLDGYANSGTGLTHFGARWYDTDTGVFTQPDPETHNNEPLGDNPYRYGDDDPRNNEDVSGEGSCSNQVGCDFGGAAAFIAAGGFGEGAAEAAAAGISAASGGLAVLAVGAVALGVALFSDWF